MTPEQRARVEALFSKLIELPGRDRNAELHALCPDDREVREAVLKLLRSDDDDRTGLSERIRGAAASAITDETDPMIGTTIGAYKILATLGEGGFGVVYLADQREPVQRRVALKIIKPGMGSRAIIARFEQERQALAIMDHPNVAKVFDGGMTTDGRPYFVMELVKGIPITDFADREQLTIHQRLELFIPVCEAVQHAHTKGIIHRDLKPTNILVVSGDTTSHSPTPKVIDFGIAKAVRHALTDKTIFTEQGQIIGTPEYMSPEQAEMGASDIDTRTDVFSLGVVLYELISGLLPFDARTLRAAGYAEIQRIIREVEPPRPSARLTGVGDSGVDIARRRHEERDSLVRVLRRELEWIPLMAMRKNRDMRYRSASELADDLRNYLGGKPLIAGPESQWYRLSKMARKHRLLAASAAAIAFAIVAAAGVSLWFAASEREQRKIAVKALQQASLERDVALSVETFLNEDLLAAPDPEHEGPDALVVDLLDGAAKTLEGRFVEQPGVKARIAAALGRAYISVGHPGKAVPVLEQATALFAIDPSAQSELDSSRLRLSEAKWRSSASGEAVKLLESHIATLGDNPDDVGILAARNQLGGALKKLGRLEEAETVYRDVAARRTRVLGPDNQDTIITLFNVALIPLERGNRLQRNGSAELAQAEFRTSLDAMKRLREQAVAAVGANHPVTVPISSEIASLLNRLNLLEDASSEYERTLPAMHRVFGHRHWRTLQFTANFGALKKKFDTPETLREAARLLEEALAGYRETTGRTSVETIHVTTKLSEVCEALKETDRGRWLLIRAYDDLTAAGVDKPALARQATLIASFLERQGDSAEAARWRSKISAP